MQADQKVQLWTRLSAYRFENLVAPAAWDYIREMFGGPDASSHAFADKLSRKLNWDRAFARRAVAEYKKFLYLGQISNVPVTPSSVIDSVWHEHLLFTRAYHEFCKEVLGRHFEHYPELVPMGDQTDIFRMQYRATLELYRREFGTDPPADVWAVPKFGPVRGGKQAEGRRRPPAARRSARAQSDRGDSVGDDPPLHVIFSRAGVHQHTDDGFDGFDGGRGGGAGAARSWPDLATDAGDAGAGSGGDGGSGCSSGCGGD